MPRFLIFGLLLSLQLFLRSSAAVAGDFRIVPGRRIGSARLGMTPTAVIALLHQPSTTRHAPGGLIVDTWLSHRLVTTDPNGVRGLKRDYLIVLFRQNQAVQIEVSSPQFTMANGLSEVSTGHGFARRFPNHRTPTFPMQTALHWMGDHYAVSQVDPEASSPAGKHFVVYGDAVHQGIAWKYGAWGDMAPEADPDGPLEAVIVHQPGQRVLLNPNDGLPYAGTAPARKGLEN